MNTFIDNCDLKVPILPLLTYTVATLEKAEGLVKTLKVIVLDGTFFRQKSCCPSVQERCLPLTEDCVIYQVCCAVHAAKGVVNRLVPHCQSRIIGHNGVVKDVLGVFAWNVLLKKNTDAKLLCPCKHKFIDFGAHYHNEKS